MEIGAILKEAREEKNISLENLQETTKIQKRYLKAIEQGNFHILPGTFYARAFIKEYAEAVGLNAEELLENHHNELPTSQPKSDVEYTRMQRSSRRENQTSKDPIILSILPKVIVILLVIVVFFIAFTLYKKSIVDDEPSPTNNQNDNEIIRNGDNDLNNNQSQDNEDNNSNNTDDEELNNNNTDNNEKVEDESEEASLSLVEEGSGSKPESTFELSNAGEDVILLLEPSGESWIDIRNEQDEYLFRGMTEADTPIELDVSGESSIHLNIGSAPNLPTIYISDIEFEYPLDPNQFVTQRIWFNITDTSNDE